MMGLVPRVTADILAELGSALSSTTADAPVLRASFVEVYNEHVRDLLLPDGVPEPDRGYPLAKDAWGNYQPVGVTEVALSSMTVLADLLREGGGRRVTAATGMNAASSRSHAVFTLRLDQSLASGSDVPSAANATATSATAAPAAAPRRATSIFRLVDLAGSERISQTGARGTRLNEARKINLSLSTLSQCIVALAERKPHVPFRNSKLTQMLSSALGTSAAGLTSPTHPRRRRCSRARAHHFTTAPPLTYARHAQVGMHQRPW